MPLHLTNLRLPSVRNRILLFGALVTLLPSIGLGWAYFNQTKQALLESSQRELLGRVGQVRREFDLWFKERYYDIRVFSNSYLLSEGLQNYLTMRSKGSGKEFSDDDAQLAKMEGYLSLVLPQLNNYARLLVFDRDARLITQSPQSAAPAELPDDWRDRLEAKKVIARVEYDPQGEKPSILAAVPILTGDGSIVGLLAAEIKLDALSTMMTSFLAIEHLQTGSAELLLLGPGGKILLSTANQQAAIGHKSVYEEWVPPHLLAEYVNSQDVPVIGIRTPMPEFDWNLVIEKRRDQVFSEVIKLRNRTLLGVGVLVSLIGFLAYLLSRGIVAPVKRLTEAAGKVADGNLDVNIPVMRDDELGKATQVFNDMVDQLRQSRERLEQLSTMDSLTQLANRRRIQEKLTSHLERFRRNGTPFSVLLVDADHFKRINDSAGHAVGDKVLFELGSIFKRLLRTVDAAGRYGGEEFLIILDETRGEKALQTAERIRLVVESAGVSADETTVRFTVSIGVAEISAGEDEDQLIVRADNALYQAKREGRSRSVLAPLPKAKVAYHPAIRKTDPV